MKLKKNNLYILAGIIAVIVIVILLRAVNKPAYPDIISERPILGNPDAKVKIVEFSDLQCPACKSTSSYPHLLINDFGNDISFEYKHFPLSMHQYAFKAAEASECANDQGKFWEYEIVLFLNQPKLSVKELKAYAKQVGLDTKSFNACLDSEAKGYIVEQHLREGYALNVPGTPSFFINGKRASSLQYDDIKAMVESELNP